MRRPQIDSYHTHHVEVTLSYPDTFKPIQTRTLKDIDHDEDVIEHEPEQTFGEAETHNNPRKRKEFL